MVKSDFRGPKPICLIRLSVGRRLAVPAASVGAQVYCIPVRY